MSSASAIVMLYNKLSSLLHIWLPIKYVWHTKSMFLNVHYKDVLKVQNKEHDYYSLQINDRFQFDCNNATDLLIPCTLIFESVHWAFTHKALSAIILNMVAQCRGAARISVRRCFFLFFCFLAFDSCRFCVVIWFFHPRHNGQWPPTSKDFLSQILSISFIFLS